MIIAKVSLRAALLKRSRLLLMSIAPFTAVIAPAIAQPTTPPSRFTDTQGHWAAACIDRTGDDGLMKGYGDRRFLPNNNISRAEFAALMMQVFGDAPKVRNAPVFADVPASFWAKGTIQNAYERGFLEGYPNNQFRPYQEISRAQAMTIFAKVKKLSSTGDTDRVLSRYFSDQSEIPGYARGAIAAATKANLIVNYPEIEQFRPSVGMKRGEVAALLCQATEDGYDLRKVPEETIVRVQYCEVQRPLYDADGFAVVFAGADEFGYGKSGMQDRSGRWIIPADYGELHPFFDGLALGFPPPFDYYQQVYSFIDQQGKVVFSRPIEGHIRDFSEGLAAFATASGQWGFLDKTGTVAISPQFSDAQPFVNGLARVQQNGRFGFINQSGQVIIPIQYEAAHEAFQEGLVGARLQADERWGYLDAGGNWAIAPQFQAVEPFSQGLARVSDRNNTRSQWSAINQAGEAIARSEPNDSICLPLR
ncbi:MAG: WG repeat-containing protein [Phormidesmis sp.]